jgi:hypothetical protein
VTFEWRMLLFVAIRLLDPPTAEERGWRSAINRAYYAAYGEAREFAIGRGLNMQSGGQSHDRVWQFLRRGGGYPQVWERAAAKAVGDLGIELRAMRVQADYFRTNSPSEADVQRAVSLANLVVKRILGLP